MRRTQRLRLKALSRQHGRCHYCKDPVAPEHATADHMWPQCRRGRTYQGNIVAACLRCNRAKGSMSHIEFYKLIDRKMPHGAPAAILVIWATRRMWKRTLQACATITRRAA
jgi:5-methylcytosine-specific restriction endonuclease McrA